MLLRDGYNDEDDASEFSSSGRGTVLLKRAEFLHLIGPVLPNEVDSVGACLSDEVPVEDSISLKQVFGEDELLV